MTELSTVTGVSEDEVGPRPRDCGAERVDLLGVGFDRVQQSDVVLGVMDALANGTGGWISTPNSHHLRECQGSPAYRQRIADADYVVADGMPLVWASRLQGNPLPERVAGSDLVWSIARAAARDGRSIFLLGGDDGVASRAKERLENTIPGINVAGAYCPPVGFEHDHREQEQIEEMLRDAQPEIVYVGLGFPKQEDLISRLEKVLQDSWFVGVGISLSFISEDQARAPRWMQKTGLEWLHRLSREPRRLFRRYIRDGIPFTLKLLASSLATRVFARPDRLPSAAALTAPPPAGSPTIETLSQVEPTAAPAAEMPSHVELEIVVPVLNEERRIEPTLQALTAYLKAQPWRSSIIVVDNGCTDRTTTVADRLSSDDVPITVIGCKNRGKGAAVRKGILSSRAPRVGFCDADLSTPVEMIGPAMAMMDGGRPAVIGSRRCPGGHYAGEQSLGRRMGGAAFRRMARSVAKEIADTQCGFKFFHADVARTLFSHSQAEGFAFDVEIVGLAHAAGIEVTELPVRWSDAAGSTFRTFSDGQGAMRELIALRSRFRTVGPQLLAEPALRDAA